MSNFDLTIVIPSIGRPSLLEALDSIQEPNLKLEILIVADKVRDMQQLQTSVDRVGAKVVQGENKGAPGARNLGLQLATGEYLAFLDDDDLWLPGKATAQIAALKEIGSVNAFSVAGVSFLGAGASSLRQLARKFDPQSESLGNYLVGREYTKYRGGYFCSSAILGPREFLQRTEWNEIQNDHDDWDYVIRLYDPKVTQIAILEEPLVVLRQGSDSSLSVERNWDKSLHFLKRFPNEIYGRSKSDFALIHVLLPAIQKGSLSGVVAGVSNIWPNIPRRGAWMRFAGGLLLGK